MQLICHIIGDDADVRDRIVKKILSEASSLDYAIVTRKRMNYFGGETLTFRKLDLIEFARQGAPLDLNGRETDTFGGPRPLDVDALAGALRAREAAFND
jgi:hypothetical protein